MRERRIRQLVDSIKDTVHKNKTADLFVNNYDFRTLVCSALSFAGGIGLAVFNTVVYAVTGSLWCGVMAFYHILLVSLRGYVLFAYRKAKKKEVLSQKDRTLLEMKRYRFCGIVFILLTLCLMAMIAHIVRRDKVFDYEIYVIYTVAAFTLYQMVVAVINYIKARSRDSYTVRALRCINLTTALVSFISLQAIALDTFSQNVNIPIGNAVTGFVISGLTVASGVYMIIHSTTKIKAFKANVQNSMRCS